MTLWQKNDIWIPKKQEEKKPDRKEKKLIQDRDQNINP